MTKKQTLSFLTAIILFLVMTFAIAPIVVSAAAPDVSASKTYSDYVENSIITIDSAIVVTDGDANVTGAKVSIGDGYVSSEDTLEYTTINGISGSWNSTKGILTLVGNRSGSDYQAAFRNVKYRNSNDNPNTTQRNITFAIGNSSLYSPDTGHYYEFVSASIEWAAARTAASVRTFYGLQGYLATITSAEENAFLATKVSGDAWIGANDSVVEGDWRWVTGPEGTEDGGKGRLFWIGRGSIYGGSAVGINYTNWDGTSEPNNSSGEDYAYMIASNGAWNDYPTTGFIAQQSYFVEYGGMAGDPTLNLTATITVNVTAVNDAPTVPGAFTSPTSGQVIKGTESINVNWSSSTDPEGDSVEYDLWFFNGTWAQIFSLLGTNSTIYALPADDTNSAILRVYANDTALNSSARDVTFTVDSTIPIATFVSPTPANNSNLSQNYININVTVTETNLKNVTTYLYNGTGLVNSNISTSSPLVYNFTGLDDGTYYINATAYDDAGYLNVTETRTILLDTISPTISIMTPTASSKAYKSGGQEMYVNFTYIEVNPKNYTILIQNATDIINSTNAVTTGSPVNVSFTINSTAADGYYNVTVTMWDNASNTNILTEVNAVVMDTTAPTAPTNLVHTDADVSKDNYDNDNSTDISWSASSDALNVTYNIYRDGVLNGSTTSLTYTFTNETEDPHIYNVSAVDYVGNINTMNASVAVIVDLTDPVIHNVSLSDYSPSYGQEITVSVNVTDDNIFSVSAAGILLDQQSGLLWNGTITAGYGTNTVTVTAYDNASRSVTNSSVTYTGPNQPTQTTDDSSSGPVNLPTTLPENVVSNEVKGTIFSEPVTSADLKFTKGYITLVTVDAKGTISEVMVTIQKLAGKPSEIKVAPPSGAVHTYHNIDLGRIGDNDLEGATIKFRAEKKWIADNGGDRNAVVVMRYHDDWMALETKTIGEDDEYVFFSARTPGFSTFAITMQLEEEVAPVEVQTSEPVVEEIVDEPAPVLVEPQEETSNWWFILVMAAIAGVVFFVYKNKKDESEK